MPFALYFLSFFCHIGVFIDIGSIFLYKILILCFNEFFFCVHLNLLALLIVFSVM